MRFDVIVVGAGPAGSTAAKALAEHGVRVLLLDKERFPRDKPCGGGIPARVLRRYPYIDTKAVIESYTYGGTVYSPSLRFKIDAMKPTPMIAMTLRRKFDAELVRLATVAGAVLKEGAQVTGVEVTVQGVWVSTAQGETLEASVLVAADGVHSFVATTLGFRKPGAPQGVCVLQEFAVDSLVLDQYFTASRRCLVHARFKALPGYGWVFPKKEHLNIGFGAIQPESEAGHGMNLRQCYDEYLAYLREQNLVPKDLPETAVKGGVTPTRPLEKTYADRVLLVGDAGGFINPLSGEGIYYAMASAELAAQTIIEGLAKNQFSEEFLSRYETRWRKDFGKDLALVSMVLERGGLENREQVFEIASQDRKLTDLLIGVITGELGTQKNKWKIVRRYLVASLKFRFRRKKQP